jgi:transcriptional regulator with XRE-family HTH domain
MTTFAGMVNRGLAEADITLRELCRQVDMDPSFFSKVLSGKRSPPSSEDVLRKIARTLSLDAPELIVAAGRIPSEWEALLRDKGLFESVHHLATAKSVPSAPPRPSRAVEPREPVRFTAPQTLSEELL